MDMADSNNGKHSGGTSAKNVSPPYVSFVVFRTFLDWLAAEGIPLRLDRSFLIQKYSGGTIFQLMAGLRFLGLVEDDRPKPELERLVHASADDRKAELKRILRESYTSVDFEALKRSTPGMLREWLKEYGLDGSTQRKAESFFINAVKESGMEMSSAISKKARNRLPRSAGAVGRRGKKPQGNADALADKTSQGIASGRKPLDYSSQGQGSQTTIKLESGGAVTLTIAADLFQLSKCKKDRDFVLALIDQMNSYDVTPNP